jgi:hypothetical protein
MMRPDCKSAVAMGPFYPSRNSEMGDPGHLKGDSGLGLPVSESWTVSNSKRPILGSCRGIGCTPCMPLCLFRTLAVESGESQRNVLNLCRRG